MNEREIEEESKMPELLSEIMSNHTKSTKFANKKYSEWSNHLYSKNNNKAIGKIFPDLTIHKSIDVCPYCNLYMQDDEIKQGWAKSINDYTTECNKCYYMEVKGLEPPPKPVRFVPRIRVHTDFTFLHDQNHTDELWTEYLSPWILLKEVYLYIIIDSKSN